ncbi:MAG: DUF3094 family protein [Spongiibacteraceae bacterium]|nr:DUF3094 family protein [Spongiibacteraceae bacterium]
MTVNRQLKSEDQERVDKFVSEGINAVERKPFRPFRLLLILIVFVVGLGIFSRVLVNNAGLF